MYLQFMTISLKIKGTTDMFIFMFTHTHTVETSSLQLKGECFHLYKFG